LTTWRSPDHRFDWFCFFFPALQGGMGAATRISYNNVTMVGAANPIYIDQFYGGGSGKVSVGCCNNSRSSLQHHLWFSDHALVIISDNCCNIIFDSLQWNIVELQQVSALISYSTSSNAN
jgi:hypothetical protein